MAGCPIIVPSNSNSARCSRPDRRPVAIAFLDTVPQSSRNSPEPSLSLLQLWPLAAAGRTFYTVPSDHWNCPVGGYTHSALTPERMPEFPVFVDIHAETYRDRLQAEFPALRFKLFHSAAETTSDLSNVNVWTFASVSRCTIPSSAAPHA